MLVPADFFFERKGEGGREGVGTGNLAQALAAELKASSCAQVCIYYTGYSYYFALAGENLVITSALILQSIL